MVVLLERVGEDFPVAVVVGDPFVAFGQLAERVVVQGGDHRAQEFAQALPRLVVEVDEDEAVPHIAVHGSQPVFGRVEVEELRFLLDEFQGAVEVVAPAVVLAGELPAGAAGLLSGKVVPHQLVSPVPADVVEGPNLLVSAFDQDHRGADDLDLLGQIAADARQFLHAGDIEPGPFEDRFAFEFVKLPRSRIPE